MYDWICYSESLNLSEAANLVVLCLMNLSWPLLHMLMNKNIQEEKKKKVLLGFKQLSDTFRTYV